MEFSAVVKGRRTIRRFKQIPVPEANLRAMINAARLSPSGGNAQPAMASATRLAAASLVHCGEDLVLLDRAICFTICLLML